MATFMEMLESSFFLIVNTVILLIATVVMGPVMDWLSLFISNQPSGLLSATPVQYVFGTFYGMILMLELGLFIQLFLTPIKQTDYNSGEEDW